MNENENTMKINTNISNELNRINNNSILNNSNIILDLEEIPNVKMPELKYKKREINKKVPHFPNKDVPMKKEEINEFKRKHWEFSEKYIYSRDSLNSERDLLKKITSENVCDNINNDIYNNDIVNIGKDKLYPKDNEKYNKSLEEDSDNTIDNYMEITTMGKNCLVKDPYIIESRTNDYRKGYFYHKLGNCYSFFADENGNPKIIIGPQWYMFIVLTVVVNFSFFFVLFYFWDEYEQYEKYIGIFIWFFFQTNYTLTFILNPGFPKNTPIRRGEYTKPKKNLEDCIENITGNNLENILEEREKEKHKINKHKHKHKKNLNKNNNNLEDNIESNIRKCSECGFFYMKDKKVNHCFTCGICIEGYEYHCFWTGKCIGRNNILVFRLFLIGLLLLLGFCIIAVTTVGK